MILYHTSNHSDHELCTLSCITAISKLIKHYIWVHDWSYPDANNKVKTHFVWPIGKAALNTVTWRQGPILFPQTQCCMNLIITQSARSEWLKILNGFLFNYIIIVFSSVSGIKAGIVHVSVLHFRLLATAWQHCLSLHDFHVTTLLTGLKLYLYNI